MQERHVQEARSDGFFSACDAFAKYAEDESTDFVRVRTLPEGSVASSLSPIEAQVQLDIAERECLAARSTFTLGHNAILDALVVFPCISHLNESCATTEE